jgi:hypothetical protein
MQLLRDDQEHAETSENEGVTAADSFLVIEVITYQDLWQRAQVVVDFIERALQELDLLNQWLEVTTYPRRMQRKIRGRRRSLRPFAKKWPPIRDEVLRGDFVRVMIQKRLDESIHSDAAIDVDIASLNYQGRGHDRLYEYADPRDAKLFKLCVNTKIWPDGLTKVIVARAVGLACDLFVAVDGACGYVTIGERPVRGGDPTPYEERESLAERGINVVRLCEEVRGTFWGNLLSARHVERLGGTEAVCQQVPCCISTVLGEGINSSTENQPMYLQVTPSIHGLTPTENHSLEVFLEPILISSRGEVSAWVLGSDLVAGLHDVEGFRRALTGVTSRTTRLPEGGLLVECDWGARGPFFDVLDEHTCEDVRGYREIPRLRSRVVPDDVVVFTIRDLIQPLPKTGHIFPLVMVQACIPGYALEFRVNFAQEPTPADRRGLAQLVERWAQLIYEDAAEGNSISYGSPVEHNGCVSVWHAQLAPVRHDAYVQLVMMLDAFSRTCRLEQVRVSAWDT